MIRAIAVNAALGFVGAIILVGFVGGMVAEKIYEGAREKLGKGGG